MTCITFFDTFRKSQFLSSLGNPSLFRAFTVNIPSFLQLFLFFTYKKQLYHQNLRICNLPCNLNNLLRSYNLKTCILFLKSFLIKQHHVCWVPGFQLHSAGPAPGGENQAEVQNGCGGRRISRLPSVIVLLSRQVCRQKGWGHHKPKRGSFPGREWAHGIFLTNWVCLMSLVSALIIMSAIKGSWIDKFMENVEGKWLEICHSIVHKI